jgi:DNA-binding NtrC family response regulator
MPHALVIEDDESTLEALAQVAEGQGFSTSCVKTLEDARDELHKAPADVILLDMILPDGNGTDLLDELRKQRGDVIIMTGEPTVDSAVAALRHCAKDYLIKPVDVRRLKAHLADAHREANHRTAVATGSTTPPGTQPMLGESQQMKDLQHVIDRVAPTDATVLIIGESGTGKELVAQNLHHRSHRKDKPLIALNCGAIPEQLIESELFGHQKGAFTGAANMRRGAFERAIGGTLFLDEVTEMPMDLQVKLLRVLETRKIMRVGGEQDIDVDVRVIAATNRDPVAAVNEGKLREDLLYRLSVFPINVAPLRDRGSDIELLANYFLDSLNATDGTKKSFTPEAIEKLKSYSWPGNVRQLRNAVHCAFILADDKIEVDHLAQPITTRSAETRHTTDLQFPVGTPIADAEQQLIMATLEHFAGDKKKTAKALGVSLKTLYNRLNAYGALDPAEQQT